MKDARGIITQISLLKELATMRNLSPARRAPCDIIFRSQSASKYHITDGFIVLPLISTQASKGSQRWTVRNRKVHLCKRILATVQSNPKAPKIFHSCQYCSLSTPSRLGSFIPFLLLKLLMVRRLCISLNMSITASRCGIY